MSNFNYRARKIIKCKFSVKIKIKCKMYNNSSKLIQAQLKLIETQMKKQ